MNEPEDEDKDLEFIEKLTHKVQLSVAHSELTRWRAHPLAEADKDKILQSLFVSRVEYEQYVNDLRESEEFQRKEAEARAAADQARLENDPAHWRSMYQRMVEREEERKRKSDLNLSIFLVCAAFAAVLYILRMFHLF
jgi:hypothetical protein